MNKVNIHRGTFLEKEELNRLQLFMSDNSFSQVASAASLSFGIVSPGSVPGAPFKVSTSTTLGTVNINQGYIFGPNGESFKIESQIDFAVPNDNLFYWLKVSPDSHNYEVGTVQIDIYGNVSGTVNFSGLVRGQSSGVPTCVRFMKLDGSEPLNNAVFQVVDIINNNTLVLSSGFTFKAESDLKVIILGSIPMGQRFTDEQLEGLYTYGSYKLTLIPEQVSGIEPPKDSNEYYISRLKNSAGSVTILDERTEFWNMGGGGTPTKTYTITVSPTPSDATVVIDGRSVRSVDARTGQIIRYSVSKIGYLTSTGTYTVGSSDFVVGVNLQINPDPSQKVTVTVKTSNGTTSEGFISLNNPSVIDKFTQTLTVDQGTSVNISALAATGFLFTEWMQNGTVFNNVSTQNVTINVNTTYVAIFSPDVPADHWDFDVYNGVGTDHELMSVPVGVGSSEFEAETVKIK